MLFPYGYSAEQDRVDIYHQIKLFHQDDRTDLPVDPPNLKEYFKLIDKAERKLPELLANILIRAPGNIFCGGTGLMQNPTSRLIRTALRNT